MDKIAVIDNGKTRESSIIAKIYENKNDLSRK